MASCKEQWVGSLIPCCLVLTWMVAAELSCVQKAMKIRTTASVDAFSEKMIQRA